MFSTASTNSLPALTGTMHDSRRRVVVTGLGVICGAGRNADEFWQSLREGRTGIRPLEGIETSLSFACGCQVPDYDATDHFEPRQVQMLDPFSQFALIAAREAVADAGLTWTQEQATRAAVVTGSSGGGQGSVDVGLARMYRDGKRGMPPLTIIRRMENAGAAHISSEFGITGPVFTLATACSSANHAIGHAFWLIRGGVCDTAIAGGSEAPFSEGFLKSWEAMRVVSPDTCRPFSRDRSGMILGEGGGMLTLEEYTHARNRGASIHGEVLGFGMSSNATNMTESSLDGVVLAITNALTDAAIEPTDVDYINAHGTATRINDPTEAAAIHQVFGAHADRLPISSTKSIHAHTLGAAGAIEAIATLLALRNGLLPPTANFTEPDPECDLDVVPNQAREARPRIAISNAFGFGGVNAVLVFQRSP